MAIIDGQIANHASVKAWLETQAGKAFYNERQELINAKRKRTMSLAHADMTESHLALLSMGFEGSFENGTGEFVAVVQADQESSMLTKRKRGKRGGRKQRKG